MARAIAWTVAALAILISCALAYQETGIMASGPPVEDEVVNQPLEVNAADDEELDDDTSAEMDRARRYLVEELAKKLGLPLSAISMGTAVGESTARVRINCSEAQRPRIDRVLDDLQFPLKQLEVVTITLTDANGKTIEVRATGSETLGYPLSRDLFIAESLKGFSKPLADAILMTGIAHNQKCMQSDPEDPGLVANEIVLKSQLSKDASTAIDKECSRLKEIEKKTVEKDPDRSRKAAQLSGIICGTAGGASTNSNHDLSKNGASNQTIDEQVQFIRESIHPDTVRSYLISYVYAKNNQPQKAQAARNELPELDHQIKQSLLVDIAAFALTGIGFLAYLVIWKPKLFRLPQLSTSVACPYPYGWIKPHIIFFITVIFGIGGFIAQTAALGTQAEEMMALLASYFEPVKRAWLDNLDEALLLVPVILATTWLINKGKFVDFVHLKLKTDNYSTKELIRIGFECFILSWTPAMVATVLSYWFHFPWQKSSTVSTELLISAESIPAVLILFLGTAVLAPILEEIAFRGMLHPSLRRHFSMWPSLIIGSAFFAIVHFEFTPWWIADKFIFAAVNIYAFEKTGSIVPGIICHLLTNLLVTVLMVAALA